MTVEVKKFQYIPHSLEGVLSWSQKTWNLREDDMIQICKSILVSQSHDNTTLTRAKGHAT